MVGFITLVFLALTQIALGQDAAAPVAEALPPDMFVEKGFFETILSGEFFAKIVPIVVATQVLLYGIAEGLTRLSVLTETKWDNKLAGWVSEAAWVAGVLVGKFGYGTPKLVIEEKTKDAQEKKPGA